MLVSSQPLLIIINSNNNYLALKILGISQVSGTQNYLVYDDDPSSVITLFSIFILLLNPFIHVVVLNILSA